MSGPRMEENVIINNRASVYGGGVFLYFFGNGFLRRNLIAGNESEYGGGVCVNTSAGVRMENNTITENRCQVWGGGIYTETFSYPEVLNCIVYGNDAGNYRDIFVSGNDSISIHYSDVYGGWPGIGNIDADPLFADPIMGDFNLTWANYPEPDSTKSPCIDAGLPDSSYFDPDNTRNDMGTFYFHQYLPAIRDLTISLSADTVRIIWSTVPGAAEYLIFNSDQPYFLPQFPPVMTVPAPDTSVILTGISRPAVYYLVISRR